MAESKQGEELTDEDLAAAQPEPEEVDDDTLLDTGVGDPRPASEAAWLGAAKPAMPVPPQRPAPLPEVGAGETFINRAANNVPLGRPFVDMASAAQIAAAPALGRLLPDALARHLPGVLPEPGAKLTPEAAQALLALGASEEQRYEPGIMDTYRGLRDNRAARTQVGSEQNPVSGLAGAGTGLALSVLAPIPAAKLKVGGAGWGGRIASGAASGAFNGGINGLIAGATDGQADTANGDILGTLGDAAIGGAGGAVFGGALGAVADPASTFVRNIYRGFVTPTKAAQYLRGKGVELTTGQMDPSSALGQLEEVSTSVGAVGPSIKAQREAGRQSWQDVVMNEALPPGMAKPDASLPVDERLAAMYEGFVPAYAPAKGVRITPQSSGGQPLLSKQAPAPQPIPRLFDNAVDDPNVLATSADRELIRDYLKNQLSLVSQNSRGGKVDSDVILEMRHNVRQKVNEALKEQLPRQAQLLKNAEAQLTDILETSLPDDAYAALRAADAQYARYKPLEAAIATAGDQPGGFTPSQLSRAIRAGIGDKGAYARGAGGEMRDLASAGRQVFDMQTPQTGARLMGMGPFQWIGAPMSFAANLKPVQKALLGEYGWQKSLGGVDSAVSGALNRFPYERIGEETLSSMRMTNTPESRASTPEGQRFYQQVVSRPDLFGPYAARLQQAAQNGPESLAMQDFLLSADPAYMQARKAAATQGE